VQRRELLKSFVALPFVQALSLAGKPAVEAAAISPGHYIAFVDCQAINFYELAKIELPSGVTMDFIALKLRQGQKIDDAVTLYQVKT
jgi:hypothetical protein